MVLILAFTCGGGGGTQINKNKSRSVSVFRTVEMLVFYYNPAAAAAVGPVDHRTSHLPICENIGLSNDAETLKSV